MPQCRAVLVTLTAAGRKTLKKRVCGAKTAYRDWLRAQIVLAAVPLEVGAQQHDQLGRDRDRPHLVLGAVLEPAGFAGGAVVGPAAPGAEFGGGQVDAAPSAGGQVAVGFPQRHHLGWAQGGVVEAPEERLQVLTARALCPDHGEQRLGLSRAGDDAAVDGLGDLGGFPLDPFHRVGAQQPLLDGIAERVVDRSYVYRSNTRLTG